MPDIDALARQWGIGETSNRSSPSTSNIDSLAQQWGIDTAPTVVEPTRGISGTSLQGTYDLSGVPSTIPVAPIEQPPPSNTMAGYVDRSSLGVRRLFKDAPAAIARVASEYPGNVGRATVRAGQAAFGQIDQGLREIGNRQYLPTGQSITSPSTWELGGIGRVAGGVVGAAMAPVTGVIEATVKDPITAVAGRAAGERAEMLANFAVPIAPGAGALARRLPSNKAFGALVEAVGPDNIRSVVQQLRENPRLSIMDVAPGARLRGQRLAVVEGPHQAEFVNFVRDRTEGARSAVLDAYDTAMGGAVNAHTQLGKFKADAQRVGREAIQPAIAAARPVNITPIIEHIDNTLNPGVNSVVSVGAGGLPSTAIEGEMRTVRRLLTNDDNTIQRTSPSQLHDFQAALRSEADNLINSADGQARRKGFALMDLRNRIVNQIDEASPRITNPDGTVVGAYRNGLNRYRSEMDIQTAFDRGYNLRRNRETVWEDHPDFVREWVGGLSPQELQAAREGARLGFRDAVGRRNNPRGQAGTETVNIDYNLEKARLLFGKREVNDMARKLRDERNIMRTNDDLERGSQTAMRSAADASIPQHIQSRDLKTDMLPLAIAEGASTLAGAPGVGATLFTLNRLVGNPIRAGIRNKMTTRQNNELTRLLQVTGQDAETLDRLLAHAPSARQSIAQRTSNTLSNVVRPLIP